VWNNMNGYITVGLAPWGPAEAFCGETPEGPP
jgi:hypothetical protein